MEKSKIEELKAVVGRASCTPDERRVILNLAEAAADEFVALQRESIAVLKASKEQSKDAADLVTDSARQITDLSSQLKAAKKDAKEANDGLVKIKSAFKSEPVNTEE